MNHEAVADEFLRGVFGGQNKFGWKILAEWREAEAFVQAEAEEDCFFEDCAILNVEGSQWRRFG